mmetsp:Transcript_27071/g.37784  ORF Transcript_27071/g.37784 Transcript_27071/m.37784 type:complete len:205 (-) Transcript_27071:86-700(-)
MEDLDEEETKALVQEAMSDSEFSPSYSLPGGRMTANEELKLVLSGLLISIAVATFTYPIVIGFVLQEDLQGCTGKFTLYNKYSSKARRTYHGIDLQAMALASSVAGIGSSPAWGSLLFFSRYFLNRLHLQVAIAWYVLCYIAQIYLFAILCQNLWKWNENVNCGGNENKIQDAVSGFIISALVSSATSAVVLLASLITKEVFLI